MTSHTLLPREEPKLDIVAQLDEAMTAVRQANDLLSAFEHRLHTGNVEISAELVGVHQNAYSAMMHVLQSLREMVVFLHSTNQKQEMDIHRLNSELVELSLNLLRKQNL